MADASKDTIAYQPRPRPEWVRGANDMGRAIDARSTVPLDEESLLRFRDREYRALRFRGTSIGGSRSGSC